MAISTNDILSVKFFFDQGGNEALVTSFWKVISIADPNVYNAFAEVMARAFMSLGDHENVMATNAFLRRVVLDNLTITGEFGEWTGEIGGTSTGDIAPPFVALSIKQAVSNRMTRAGYRRIPFLTEAVVTGDDFAVGAPTRSAIEAFWKGDMTYFYDTDDFGVASFELQPVIVGRTYNVTLEYYELDLSKINVVDDATIQRVTSQTSRKT